jgi:hypothetical protein
MIMFRLLHDELPDTISSALHVQTAAAMNPPRSIRCDLPSFDAVAAVLSRDCPPARNCNDVRRADIY